MIENKKYYTIDDIEKYLFLNFKVEKFKKLADVYSNIKLWKDNYDDILSYTDGAIIDDNYYLYIIREDEIYDGKKSYNEIFIQCITNPTIPERFFALDAWGKCGSIVGDMVNANINYLIELEKQINKDYLK